MPMRTCDRSFVRRAAAALVVVAAASPAFSAENALRVVALDEAIAEARAQHPTVAIAKNQVRRAEALVEQSRASSLPTLTMNGVYTRLDDDRALAGRVLQSCNQLQCNVALVVPLVAPKAWVLWAHAKDNEAVSAANAKESERQLALAVARTYLAVVGQKRLVDVAARARDTAHAHHEVAHTRFLGGVGNRLDETRAHQELATSETVVQNARVALARTREALGVLVGTSEPVDATDSVSLPASPNAGEALAEAPERRGDLVALRRSGEAASQVARDSWVDFLPTLSGAFQPFYQNPATVTQPETGWQAQLLLSLPLYDGGLRYGVHAERAALERDAKLKLDAALSQARSDLRIAALAVAQADLTLTSAREAAALAVEALALASEAYRAGATTNIEVIDAERRARDAETQAAIAEDGARQARLELLAASGRYP
jgi:outer membrane protein TolC